MHHKNIKRNIIKQIKTELKRTFSKWHRLIKKEKKALVKSVSDQVLKDYDFEQSLPVKEKLLGIEEQMDLTGIMNLKQMEEFIKTTRDSYLFDIFKLHRKKKNIKDEELRYIDELFDTDILEKLLAYSGYSKNMRKINQSSYFKAEILKTVKYPEISYRKFCTEKYLGMDQKENREFTGLSLRKKQMISHSQLSQFRSGLSFSQTINMLVYVLYHFQKEGIMGDCLIHEVDSTELPNTHRYPLHTININGKKIKIYSDLDSDCGSRRSKRDKSKFFVGYRMHTLVGIHPKTGHSFPLVSLIAPGNHHDSHFLGFLIKLGQAMGIEIKLVTADEAYHDKTGEICKETGVHVITPASEKVKFPDHVTPDTKAVTMDEECDIAMTRLGNTDEGHEYRCNAQLGECQRCSACPKYRLIPFDNGVFQRIPLTGNLAQEALDIRKNAERAFNLLKHREGLETVRGRSQQSLIVQSTFATIATLLIEMMGTRKKDKKEDNGQIDMLDLAS